MGKYLTRQGPNLPTVQKIKKLAEYRESQQDRWGKPPSMTSACKKFSINYRTVRRHASELVEKWNDENFHW